MFRSTSWRIFVISGIFFAMTIIPFSLFLANRFSHFAYSQVGTFNQDRIDEMAERVEYILAKLKWYSLTMYEDRTVQNWMYASADNLLQNASTMRVLSKYLSNEPYIETAYLFSFRKHEVIDSKVGLLSFEEFADQAMLQRIERTPGAFLRYFDHQIGNHSYLALQLPSAPVQKNRDGYLVVLFDKKELQKHLISGDERADTLLSIVDDRGRLILGEGDGRLEETIDNIQTGQKRGSFEMNSAAGKAFVNYARMGSPEWTIISVTEMKQFREKAGAFKTVIIVCSLLLLVALLLIAYWNSRRFVGPFRRLADQLQRKLGVKGENDYGVIEQGVVMLRDHYPLIKTEYLRQWLLQGRLSDGARAAIARESCLLDYEWLRLAVIKIDSYYEISERYDFSSRKLLKYAIGNIAEELLGTAERPIEVVDFGTDHLVVLVGTASSLPDPELTKELKELSRQVSRYVKLDVTIAVSDARRVHDDLRKVYDDMNELTLFKFVSGDDKIYVEQDFERYADLQAPIDSAVHESLIQTIRSGKEEKVLAMLDEVFTRLQTMKYTECQFQLKLLLFAIVKSFSKVMSIQSVEGIERHLRQFATLTEVREWLKEETGRMIRQLSDQKGFNRKEKLIGEIIEYVRYHTHDPMLSVDDIADHIALSAKYVRQLFHEHYGMPLSNFILNERLGKVKELLEQTSMQITEIAEQSGFQTKSHFFTAFKKATGMTPSQYRDSKAGERMERTRQIAGNSAN
ncbi:MAG: AraC family transcriptional regulator [Paenibacillus lautus]|jgi:AraC-like DNA-binding protein|uniref:AraC family transcriptional regulator n=1 Tax=Paenibacillus lautus TaxID=1401 RepID=UPI0026F37117|nr:AraC family transcriptional regulator [Paenibacillus lautus]MCI1773910.1 AraC family transcriptional regulator [Paenibacillus lautus]